MATWTMSIQAMKKDLNTAINTEVEKTKAQNYYNDEAKIVQPLVDAIFSQYKVPNDEVQVSINISSGGVGGRTGLSVNVNW